MTNETPACPCGERVLVYNVGRIPAGARFAGRMLDDPVSDGDLYRCDNCHLRFRWPRPSLDELVRLYRDVDAGHWQYDLRSRPDWRIAKSAIDALPDRSAVLDVGCFDGAFLHLLAPGKSLHGVDVNTEASSRATARGVDILATTFDDLGEDFRCDVITAFNLLEHLHDPLRFVRSAARHLNQGGTIIISTGNTDSTAWRIMGSRYWYCALPEHLSFINPDWCRWVADETGLTIRSIDFYSHDTAPGPAKRTYQATANLLYRVSPALAAAIRSAGFGELDVKANPTLRDHPPMWTAAKDHLVVVFTRP